MSDLFFQLSMENLRHAAATFKFGSEPLLRSIHSGPKFLAATSFLERHFLTYKTEIRFSTPPFRNSASMSQIRTNSAGQNLSVSRVKQVIEYLCEQLVASRSNEEENRLPYGVLASLVFPDRRNAFWYSNLWNAFKAYAERAIEQHPYHYVSTHALWCEAPPTEEIMDPDYQLTGAGMLVAIEAWCQQSIIAPSTPGCSFTTDELTELDFWQCFGRMIVDQVISVASSSESKIEPELEQGLSNLHLQEAAQQYAALTGQRLKHNRERYATHFSRIQAFGLHHGNNARTGKREAHAFFFPAAQILQNMQRYFRSSTAFEETQWRSVDSYRQYCQFTNIMLLNLCREVIRQITVMFRIEAETGGSDLLMPVDELLEADLLASCDLPTQTELILSHAEPRNWMPPVSINLQRFLASGIPTITSAPPTIQGAAMTSTPLQPAVHTHVPAAASSTGPSHPKRPRVALKMLSIHDRLPPKPVSLRTTTAGNSPNLSKSTAAAGNVPTLPSSNPTISLMSDEANASFASVATEYD